MKKSNLRYAHDTTLMVETEEEQKSLLFIFDYFNWRLITLQYCGSFCHTST